MKKFNRRREMKFSKRDNQLNRDRETADRRLAGKAAHKGPRFATFANPIVSAVVTIIVTILVTTAISATGSAQDIEPSNLSCSIVLADGTPDSDAVKESLAKKGFQVTFVSIANSKEEYFQSVVPDKIGVIFNAKKRMLQLVLPKPGAPQHVVLANMSHYFKTGIPSSWKDLAAHFPSCDDMKKGRELIDFEAVLHRHAQSGATRAQEQESYWPGWGRYFLETESLLAEPSAASLGHAQAKSQQLVKGYDELLEKVRLLSRPSIGFRDWLEKFRRLVIDEKINQYCRDRANLSDFFDAKTPCANCVSQTLLIVSLIRDSKFPLLAPWRLAVRAYPDHIAPVLYDTSDKRILDLVYGKITQDKSATIYKPEYLVLSLLRGIQDRNSALTKNFAGVLTDEFAKLNLILQKPESGILPSLPSIENLVTDLSSQGKRLYKFLPSSGPRFTDQPVPEKARIDFSQTAVAEAEAEKTGGIGRLWEAAKGGLVGGLAQMFSRGEHPTPPEATVGENLPDVEKQIRAFFNEAEQRKFGSVTASTKRRDLQRTIDGIMRIERDEKNLMALANIFVAKKRETNRHYQEHAFRSEIGTHTFVKPVLFDKDDQVREFNELSQASRGLAVVNLILHALDDATSSRHAIEIERAINDLSQGKQVDLSKLSPAFKGLRKELKTLEGVGGLITYLPQRLERELSEKLIELNILNRLSQLNGRLQAAMEQFTQAISANHRLITEHLKNQEREARREFFSTMTYINDSRSDWWTWGGQASTVRSRPNLPQDLLLERILLDPEYLYTVKPTAHETKRLEKIRKVTEALLKAQEEKKRNNPTSSENGIKPPVKSDAKTQTMAVELINEEEVNLMQFRPETASPNLKDPSAPRQPEARPEVYLPAEFFIDLFKAQIAAKLNHPFIQLASMPLLREEFITAAGKEIQAEAELEKSDQDVGYQTLAILDTLFRLNPYLFADLPINDFACGKEDCRARFKDSLAQMDQAPLSRIPNWTSLSPVLLEDFVVLKSQSAALTVLENGIAVQPERILQLTQNPQPRRQILPERLHFEFDQGLHRATIPTLTSSVRIDEIPITYLEWLSRPRKTPLAAPTPHEPTKPRDTPAPDVLTKSREALEEASETVDLPYRRVFELRIGTSRRLPRILQMKDGNILYANSFPTPNDSQQRPIKKD
jgi:hypothetical protein